MDFGSSQCLRNFRDFFLVLPKTFAMGRKPKDIPHYPIPEKEQILMNMSHQIRTPMNAIIGLTDLLIGTPLNDEQRSYLQHIRSSCDTLMTILNDIVEFSRMQEGNIEINEKEFSFEVVMQNVFNLLRPIAVEKSLKFFYLQDKEIPSKLIGDPARFQQLLVNIIGNAIKYTYQGEVSVRVNLIEEKKILYVLEIKVQDTGIGIDADRLSEIFEKPHETEFVYTKDATNTGLGLPVAKKYAELMGGSLMLDSVVDKGTTATIRLKFGKIANPKAESQEQKPAENIFFSNLNLLLVEDNKVNQILTEKVLHRYGIMVDVAENGKIAIDKMGNKPYDLILMDLQMPVMDGYSTTRFIRDLMSAPTKDLPIIAYTAHAFQGESEKCFAAGMNDYITKPFKAEELIQKIARWAPNKFSIKENSEAVQQMQQYKNDLIDLTYLYELARGSREFVNEMLETFVNENPPEFQNIFRALDEKNFTRIYEVIHKIKPSFSLMGINPAMGLIADIEYNARNVRDLPKLNADIKKLHEIMLKANERLSELIRN